MITERFADCQSLFLDLVNLNFFSQLKNKVPAPKSEMMKSKYGPLFDVKSQLIFICKDKESPVELLQFIYNFNLEKSIPEVVD